MRIPHLAKHSVTVIQPSVTAEWGQEVVDWDNPVEHTIPGCVDYALSGVEQVQGVDVSAGARQVFMPLVMDGDMPKVRTSTGDLIRVSGTDRIRRFGKTWEIIGEPGPQISATGRVSNLEVLIKRWDGEK